jgi:hypothetical protein
MTFFIALAGIAEPVPELVKTTQLQQGPGGLLITPTHKTLYRNTHIVIYILVIGK